VEIVHMCMHVCAGANLQKRKVVDLIRCHPPLSLAVKLDDDTKISIRYFVLLCGCTLYLQLLFLQQI
jgi:hypothetical protein